MAKTRSCIAQKLYPHVLLVSTEFISTELTKSLLLRSNQVVQLINTRKQNPEDYSLLLLLTKAYNNLATDDRTKYIG
jgi:hypothetical protein